MQPKFQQHLRALTLTLLVSGGFTPAVAQNVTPITSSADLDYRTRYLFAGIPFSTGGVVQGTIRVGYGSWTVNAFTNYDFDTKQVNEADVWGDYYHQFNDKLGGFIGGAVYNFRFTTGWELTPEVYGGLVLAVLGTPTLYFARDLDLTTGDHTVLTLTHGIPAGTNVTVQATGRIEYNNGYYRADPTRSSFSYADLNISVPVALGNITITPMVILVGALADDFQNRIVGGVKANFVIR